MALDHVDVAALGAELLIHDQKPVHALRLGTEQLDAPPLRKGRQRRMGRAADEVDGAVAQCRIGLVDRENQLERYIEALPLEEAQFDGRRGRKIRVRDEVRNRDLHRVDAPRRQAALLLRAFVIIVDFEQHAAVFGLERAVINIGRTARIGGRLERLAALALGVVADREIARQQIDFLPVVVDERCGRVDARLEPQQPRAASRLAPLIDIARQDLLLDAGRIAFRRRPALLQVEPMEFQMGLVHRHGVLLAHADFLSASPQECLGIILGAPRSSPAPEATLERGAPSKGSYTTGLEAVHEVGARSR